jgi:hypothetical protein
MFAVHRHANTPVNVEGNMSNENVSRKATEPEIMRDTKSHSHSVYSSDLTLRRVASWGGVLGAIALGCCLAVVLIIQMIKPSDPNHSWIIAEFKQHFAATIGIPLSALAAFCVVTLLRATTGPIEVESQVIKFHGASGPIIFWILCFVAIVGGVKLLWAAHTCP